MGILRFLLAIAVVLNHTGAIFGFKHIDGVIAVQAFFIISGFYMSMIINEKYNKVNSYKLFISNRILRLFPTYFVILFLTMLLIIIHANFGIKQGIIHNFSQINWVSKVYLSIINFSILGQDSALFMGFDKMGALHFVQNFSLSNPPVNSFLLCPPAWSLSLELIFYAIAPFLVKRNIYLILILMLLSFLIRLLIYNHGLYHDPWTYRFFPSELFFFLSGNISYRFYKLFKQNKIFNNAGLIVLTGIIIIIFLFNFIEIPYYVKQYLFYLIFIFAIPVIFNYTQKNTIDRFIGELSYPIYLSHTFIIIYCLPFFYQYVGLSSLNSLWAIIFSTLFSILLILFLIKPIDKYRAKRI